MLRLRVTASLAPVVREGYADSFAIGTAISGLETLEGQAQGLEGALADAQVL